MKMLHGYVTCALIATTALAFAQVPAAKPASPATPAASPAATAAAAEPSGPRQTQADDYTRYELPDPSTASFRIVYEVTATTVGAKYFWNPIRKGSIASNESVTNPATGLPLKFKEVTG